MYLFYILRLFLQSMTLFLYEYQIHAGITKGSSCGDKFSHAGARILFSFTAPFSTALPHYGRLVPLPTKEDHMIKSSRLNVVCIEQRDCLSLAAIAIPSRARGIPLP